MSTVVGYVFLVAVGLSLLAIFTYLAFFFIAVLIGLFGRRHDPLTEELDEFLEDLLGPNAAPWREPERLHGRRRR